MIKEVGKMLGDLQIENTKLKQTLAEIKDIASINAINTCWTSLNLCDNCEEKQEADIQCPFIKFKMILQIIEGLENAELTQVGKTLTELEFKLREIKQ